MSKPEVEKPGGSKRSLTFTPILRYSALFCMLVFITVLLGCGSLVAERMKNVAGCALETASAQVTARVDESVRLLTSFAALPEFYDPAIAPVEKVNSIIRFTPHFGYMMICVVDKDMMVYGKNHREGASLASRDYMQRLFTTGETQVTDSFAAGADGITLNYTVAVPMFDAAGTISGCLFCAIYFDEIEQMLDDCAERNGVDGILVGTDLQMMSTTMDGEYYGFQYLDRVSESMLIDTTVDDIRRNLQNQTSGSFWDIRYGDIRYNQYAPVTGTQWTLVSTASATHVLGSMMPGVGIVIVAILLMCAGLAILLRRFLVTQRQTAEGLVYSVEELEKRIYQDNEKPEIPDFDEIIRLTSNGLTDSLTGVVTRTVFLSQAAARLKKQEPGCMAALCFIDLDDLKSINDDYGHAMGDTALKNAGYVLREYEKRYDGMVGRYGGDEFVLLLCDLDGMEELVGVLDEMVLRLHMDVGQNGNKLPIQCSVGVAIWHPSMEIDMLIVNADEALYFVKQNGKGYYHIHQE